MIAYVFGLSYMYLYLLIITCFLFCLAKPLTSFRSRILNRSYDLEGVSKIFLISLLFLVGKLQNHDFAQSFTVLIGDCLEYITRFHFYFGSLGDKTKKALQNAGPVIR